MSGDSGAELVEVAYSSDKIGTRASHAFNWSIANAVITKLGTLGVGVVLARMLGPAEFGSFAVALVAMVAVLSFNELGVSLAIVRWNCDPKEIAPTVATISVAMSCILATVMVALGPWFATVMGEPDAGPVVQVMAISVVISGLVVTPAALLQREFEQRRRLIVDQLNSWTGAVVSIALAVAGWGAMSLAIGRIAGSIVGAIMFIRFSPIPFKFGFDRGQARALLRYGLPLAGSSMVLFVVVYADQLVVGSTLGNVWLGFYVLALNLANWPMNMFWVPVRAVAPATFSRLQVSPDSMRRSLRQMLGLLAMVALPMCLLIAGLALPIVEIVYGKEWAPAADPLRWLAILGAFRILFELFYDYLGVTGRTVALLRIQTVCLLASVPLLIVFSKAWGIAGASAAQVAVACVILLPLYLGELRKVGVRIRGLVGRIFGACLAAALLGAAAYGLSVVFDDPKLVVVTAGIVALIVAGLLLWLERTNIRKFRSGELGA